MHETCRERWCSWVPCAPRRLSRGTLMFCVFLCLPALTRMAVAAPPATPTDVYRVLQEARMQVEVLRKESGVHAPWPEIQVQFARYPHHVLQKCYETLAKVNRVRINRGMGEIALPLYPARRITPDEVLTAANRLVDELCLLPRASSPAHVSRPAAPGSQRPIRYVDNYRLLSELSLALDPVLGVRGFSPAEVFAQSVRVLENARFLRLSQNLVLDIPAPPLGSDHHSNHAFQAGRSLLRKIAEAEHNLWIHPCQVPEAPPPPVEPNQVYDLLQIILAEQQHIKYRLGLERHSTAPPPEQGRTSDDVIRNLQWATALMPDFTVDRALVQYDPKSLKKTPDDVFREATIISRKLATFREWRGIRVAPRPVVHNPEREPKHVYQKTLECIEKIIRLREQLGLGKHAALEYPLRAITPDEVYDLAVRLDAELNIVGRRAGIELVAPDLDPALSRNKTPADVYELMWYNAHLLDTIIGPRGYTSNDVYRQALRIVAEFEILRQHLRIPRPVQEPALVLGKHPRDVIQVAHQITVLLSQVQRRAGMQLVARAPEAEPQRVTPNEVFNEVGIILAELVALKVHLEIDVAAPRPPASTGRTPSHVFQQMEYARRLLASLLLPAPGPSEPIPAPPGGRS